MRRWKSGIPGGISEQGEYWPVLSRNASGFGKGKYAGFRRVNRAAFVQDGIVSWCPEPAKKLLGDFKQRGIFLWYKIQ